MSSLSSEIVTGDGRLLKVADIVQNYRNGVNTSVPSDKGKIQQVSDSLYSLTAYFDTVDCDTLESVTTFKVYSLSTKADERTIESVRCISDAHQLPGSISQATSNNGRFLARLRGSDAAKKQFLEIWDRSKLLKTIDTSELDVHGPINVDGCFSNFVWSPFGQQDKLLYVAQAKRPKYLSFFKEQRTSDGNQGEESSADSSERGQEYIRRDDWGERLNGIEHTMVAVLDVSKNCHITTVDVDNYSLATPQWLDNGTKIVSVAYQEEPKRLGLLHCNQRPSKIVVHDWQTSQALLQLESKTESFHTPRVSHSGDKFIYLTNPVFGVHFHAVRIFLYDIRTRAVKELVDKKSSKPGYFVENLSRNCFTSDDKHILFVTRDHLYEYMSLYNIQQSSLKKIKFPTTGLSILDFRYNVILASGSEVDTIPTLFVAMLNLLNIDDVVAWHQIEEIQTLDEIEYEPLEFKTSDQTSFLSALLIKPNLKVLQDNYIMKANEKLISEQDQLPTVVRIHGGPHANCIIRYMHFAAFYARLGLKVLCINYRGSTGVNEEYSQSLSGRVGELDVNDCLQVIRDLVHKGAIDKDKLVVNGGSHGGFLSCHLSCQEEFKFTSAIIMNPVVDMAFSFATSDIPDWPFNVALNHKNYDYSWVPSSQDLIKMYECAPLVKVSKANVPTLMLLGSRDVRVKMYQGKMWTDYLKARGVETQTKVYEDNHSLAKVESAADYLVTSAIWILNHLPK